MLQANSHPIDSLIDFWCIRNGSLYLTNFYRGKVIDNKDPLMQNRVKVYIPELMRDVKGIWCRPLYNFKKVAISPQIGDIVLVTFENGSLQQPVYLGHVRLSCPSDKEPILCGIIPDKVQDVNHTPHDFWVLETPEFRRVRFNDFNQVIQLGSYKLHRIFEIDDKNQRILLTSKDTNRVIVIDDKNNKIEISTPTGYIVIDDNGKHIEARVKNSVVHIDGSQINAQVGSNSKVHIDSNQINAKVGGSSVHIDNQKIIGRANIIMLN